MVRGHKPLEQKSEWTVAELGSFFALNRSLLVSHAIRLVRDRSVAEELVQDALMKVILAAPELDSNTHALAYMNRTISNLSIDYFRRQGRQPRLVVLDDIQVEKVTDHSSSVGLEELVAAADDAAIIRNALSLLSPAERAALVMWEVEGRSTEEISKELRIKESSVRHTLYRARASLRRVLEEVIIDESTGMTASDLLSNSYSRLSNSARKSTKTALSLILVLFVFLGFNSFSNGSDIQSATTAVPNETLPNSPMTTANKQVDEGQSANLSAPAVGIQNEKSPGKPGSKSRASESLIPGLDSQGIPRGFTISDSSGGVGSLYVSERGVGSFFISEGAESSTDLDMVTSQILKTEEGSINLLLSQRLVSDVTGLSYQPTLSYARDGHWVPLLTDVSSIKTERILSGNYLVAVKLQVDSEAETTLVIPAHAGGRDLESAPKQLIVRLLLNAEKTQVLAQAIHVIETGAKW